VNIRTIGRFRAGLVLVVRRSAFSSPVRSSCPPTTLGSAALKVGVAVLFDVTLKADPSHPSLTVVSVVGELDVATAPRLRQQLVALAATSPTGVIVDLGGVDFLDSTGLGVLLGALKRARTAGFGFALANAEPQVARVFEVTRLVDILPLHPTVAEAVAAIVEA